MEDKIIDREVSEYVDEEEMQFAGYVVLYRAIPELYDGFKISLRRCLYTMKDIKSNTKSADITGTVMKIHPHGDQYQTLVGMAQEDRHINYFIKGKGSFGHKTSRNDTAASSRYTEMKITQYASTMMKDLDKNIVDMIPTVTRNGVEPRYLPVMHPNILTNVQMGMAVGLSQDIPSFNLVDVCNAVKNYIQNGEETTLIPDFATGGYILNTTEGFEDIKNTGRGTIYLRGKYEIHSKPGKKPEILITEIPYYTTVEDIIDKIIEIVKSPNNVFEELDDCIETSDKKGPSITIYLKKNSDVDKFIKKLYAYTDMQKKYTSNIQVLYNNTPIKVGTHEIIQKWIPWRVECLRRVAITDYEITMHTASLYKGLVNIVDAIDEVIHIIRESEEEEINKNLMKRFNLTEEQAEYISSTRLKALNKIKIQEKINEIKDLENKASDLDRFIHNDELIREQICQDMDYMIDKFGQPRRTEVLNETPDGNIIVEEYPCYLQVTEQGYVKKVKTTNKKDKLKDGDKIIDTIALNNTDKVMVFTNEQNCYMLQMNDLSLLDQSNIGEFLPKKIKLKETEEIVKVVNPNNFEGHINFAYEDGRVSRVDLNAFKTKQNRKMLANAFSNHSPLVDITVSDAKHMLITDTEKVVIFNADDISVKSSRGARGNLVVKKQDNFKVKKFLPLDDYESLSALEKAELKYYETKPGNVGKKTKEEHRDLLNSILKSH